MNTLRLSICTVLCHMLALMPEAAAQVYEKVFDFTAARALDLVGNANKGATPRATLTQGRDGNFYGTTQQGGASGTGTVFKMTPAGELTTLVEFNNNGPINNGGNPEGKLVQGNDGNFYGTTYTGSSFGLGTIFKVTANGVLTTMIEFHGGGSNKGSRPAAGLMQASDGNFYGTTYDGGSSNQGTVFRMTPAGGLTTLVEFTGTGGLRRGRYPMAALVEGPDGNLYGTTYQGGTSDRGTIFKLTLGGVMTTLVDFTENGSFHKGSLPLAAMVVASDGNLYGSTHTGGANFSGTLFRLTTDGQFTTLVELTNVGFLHGSTPAGELIQASDGYLYGTAVNGGAPGHGTVFRMSLAGELTTLVEFTENGAANRGSLPVTGLVQGTNGLFYGTTLLGGVHSQGTLFKMTPAGALTTLVDFTGNGATSLGRYPYTDLLPWSDGNFYGTTFNGGRMDRGTVFKMTPGGELTTLVEFTGNGAINRGSGAASRLVAGPDGQLYGTTNAGGAFDCGTIFKMTPGGTLTTLVEFTGNGATNKGKAQFSGMLLAADGDFYGATNQGGALNFGTLFRMTPAGVLTTLVDFTGNGATNKGRVPNARLVQASDGTFYGTTGGGGASDFGTIFKMTADGVLTTLVEFTGTAGAFIGNSPLGGLSFGPDGLLYGMTNRGGALDNGTIFRMTTGGALTTLVEFTRNSGVNKGAFPNGGLMLAGDGHFYGTAGKGGVSDWGTFFRLTTDGIMTTLFDFANREDGGPYARLVTGPDGCFYGTAVGGVDGNIYRVIMPGAPLVGTVQPAQQGSTSITLQARVNARGAATSVAVEYSADGLSFPPENTFPVAIGLQGFQTALVGTALSNLTQGTTYYYRFRATSSAGTTLSPVASFSTLAEPVVAALPASDLAPTSARFQGTVNARNFDSSAVFEWGTDGNSFPNTVPATPGVVSGNGPVPVNAAVAGLVKGQTYFYRLAAANAGGAVTSGAQSFITLTDPVLTLGGAAVLGATSAQVAGLVNARGANTTAQFEVSPDPAFPVGNTANVAAIPSPVTGASDVPVSASLGGLAPGTLFYYRLTATSAGGTATTAAGTFSTPLRPAVTGVTPGTVGASGATLVGAVNANGLSTTVNFEYGIDGVNFPASVSAAPAAVTGSTETPVSAALGGLSAGTTYHFRVRATSSAGTTLSNILTFTTLVAPTASTGLASAVTAASATMAGTVNARGASTNALFEYGTDEIDFPFSVAASPSPVAGSADTAVMAVLSGLTPATTYHFRVRATSAAGTVVGNVDTFTTGQLPLVTIGSASGVSVAGATLNATVNARGSNTAVSVEVSTDVAFSAPNTLAVTPSPVTGNFSTAVSATLGSLPASTTFFYRFRAQSAGGTVVSDAASFTTPNPPVATIAAATNLMAASALLHGTVDAMGASATVSFDIAVDAAFSNPSTFTASPATVSGSGNVAVSAIAGGLQSGTTYHYRLRANSTGGSATSSAGSFTTPRPPVVSGQEASNVGSATATLNAMVDANGLATSVVFEYGASPSALTLSAAVPEMVTGDSPVVVSAEITGLLPETSYFFRVRGTNAAGEVVASPLNFIMAPSARAVTGAGTARLGATTVEATLNGTVNGFGQPTIVSFDYGTNAQNLVQSVNATPGSVSTASDTTVAASITSGLAQDTTYFFRVKVSNAGGTTLGTVQQFTTPSKGGVQAEDDFIFYAGAITIDPLRNDLDPDANPPGDKSRLTIDPQLVQAPMVSANVASVIENGKKIGYVPQFNVREVDTLIYRVGDGFGGEDTATVNLITFQSRAGFYSALVEDATNAPGRHGALSVQLGGTGAITTAFANWQGESYRMKGQFDNFGELNATFTSSYDPRVTVTLALVLGRTTKVMQGSLIERTDGVETALVPAFTLVLNGGTGGLPEAGLRTAFLTAPTEMTTDVSGDTIMGDGYVLMTVPKNRRSARLVGQLPDGEPFSFSVAAQGRTFSISQALERQGIIAGLLREVGRSGDSTASGMMANLLWRKPAAGPRTKTRYFAGEVRTNLELLGMNYPILAKTASPPIELPTGAAMNARLSLVGGDLSSDVELPVRIQGTLVTGLDPNTVKLSLRPDLGTFSGSYRHPATGKFVPFKGAFRVSLDGEPGQGRGVFRGPTVAGAVRIEATPAP